MKVKNFFSLSVCSALLICCNLSGVSLANTTGSDTGLSSSKQSSLIGSIEMPENSKLVNVLEKLKEKLPGIAQSYGKSPEALAKIAKEDDSLWIDKSGKLLHVCEGLEASSENKVANNVSVQPEAGPYPNEDTFLLHSKAGATKVIYLDFDGHTTTGTYWNSSYNGGASIYTPTYDTDGNISTFSQSELDSIQYIWQRVSEDFSPFDVDVTTQDPGVEALKKSSSADSAYGVRVCIGGSSQDWLKSSAGGIAYISSFSWNSDTPCFVFKSELGNGYPKYVAEAASHEVGHTLGLYHDGLIGGSSYYDGTNNNNWAPIMGVGYYKEVTQWSKGEYTNANNTEDDLTVMQNNGISYRTDDHSGNFTGATVIPCSNNVIPGIICNNSDKDVFEFTTGPGNVSFAASPAPLGPDLNIKLSLFDSQGILITKSENPAVLSKTLQASLSEGTYYIEVCGIGTGDPTTGYSDYASIGQYTLTGTIFPPNGVYSPIAVATANPTSGIAPLTVSLSGRESSDPDGTITVYEWNFGDGSPISSEVNPSHTYTSVGTYTAVLTVWDNQNLTGTASVVINVQSPPVQKYVYVSSIDMSVVKKNANINGKAVVTVKDSDGKLVTGASVSGTWSGTVTGTSTLTTNKGVATFSSKPTKLSTGTFTFKVTSISISGYTYDPSKNLETTDSISYTN